MKLLRVGPAGQERAAILDKNGIIRDLSGKVADIGGETLSDAARADPVSQGHDRNLRTR